MPGKSQAFDFKKPVAYDAEAKRAFHTQAHRRLGLLGAALGLTRDAYDVRTTKAGIAVSGEITLHDDCLYVQVSQPVTGQDSGILFRTRGGREDYLGGAKQFRVARPAQSAQGTRTSHQGEVRCLTARGRARRSVAPVRRDIGIADAGRDRIPGVPANSSVLRPDHARPHAGLRLFWRPTWLTTSPTSPACSMWRPALPQSGCI
jgi:hypothetical protein